jgi:hypothetical protein
MGVDTFHCTPLRRVAGLSGWPWVSLHVLLYLVLAAAGYALWSGATGSSMAYVLVGTAVVIGWYGPVLSVVVSVCLGALRLMTDVRWYWFRLVAVLLFAVPVPLLVLFLAGPAAAIPVTAVQLAMALFIVRPRPA